MAYHCSLIVGIWSSYSQGKNSKTVPQYFHYGVGPHADCNHDFMGDGDVDSGDRAGFVDEFVSRTGIPSSTRVCTQKPGQHVYMLQIFNYLGGAQDLFRLIVGVNASGII